MWGHALRPQFWLLVLLGSLVCAAAGAKDARLWVEAEGRAYVTAPDDQDAARRRAVGEALVSAALSGGASLRGHTAMTKGRITADLTILRPTGRILSHRILSAALQDGQWLVRVAAEVGPMPVGACASRRRLTVSATLPQIRVTPEASAWAEPLAQGLARDLMEVLRAHPDTDLERIAPVAVTAVTAALDYTALTRGQSVPAAGDHRMTQSITVDRQGAVLRLTLDLALIGPDGTALQRRIERQAKAPRGGVVGFVAGQNRSRAEAELTAGVLQEVRAMLDGLACQPAEARLVLSGDGLTVPLGRRHGLTRASLAFVDDPNDGFGLLEVVVLGNRETTLRPLDPSRAPASFNGLRVYFVEAGL
ncbi:flagellar assembly protein T N-terminal domain-containing protein [Roseovarius sp.]|uniref:flagellar assembly protein T N-terminal domain-containing protein n=1 Tax=Roseovarius sp. TaxID=1486281 RepID=UPI003A977045